MPEPIVSSLGTITNLWAFCHIPRTGGTALKAALIEAVQRSHGEVVLSRPFRQHTRAQDLPTDRPRFVITRDPLDRLVSLYRWQFRDTPHVLDPDHFEAFLNLSVRNLIETHPVWKSQSWWIYGDGGEVPALAVLRYDLLGTHFENLCTMLGLDPSGHDLRDLGLGVAQYHDWFTPEMAEYARELYHEDDGWWD